MRLSYNKKILIRVFEEDINPDGSYTIPNTVEKMSELVFYYCQNLKALTIPEALHLLILLHLVNAPIYKP